MPHDRNGTELKPGDRAALTGVVREITSSQVTFCNVTFVPDIGMEPGAEAYPMALSARMLEKVHAPELTGDTAEPSTRTGPGETPTPSLQETLLWLQTGADAALRRVGDPKVSMVAWHIANAIVDLKLAAEGEPEAKKTAGLQDHSSRTEQIAV